MAKLVDSMPFSKGTVSTAGTAGVSTLFLAGSSPLVSLQAGNKAIRLTPAIRAKGVKPFALCIKFLSCIFAVFYGVLTKLLLTILFITRRRPHKIYFLYRLGQATPIWCLFYPASRQTPWGE